MTLEQLIKLSLQYLEVDADINVTEYSIEDIKNNDTFSEYVNNIETSVYSAISRYTASLVLPIQEIELKSKVTVLEFSELEVKNDDTHIVRTIKTKEKIFTRIKEVYCLDNNSNVIHNIPFTLIGSKLILKTYKDNYTYFVVYYPNVMYLENYRDETETKYDVELSNLRVKDSVLGYIYVSIPDVMAINTKYMTYSELKMEDNASVANINKNYFESYLSECMNDAQTQNYQEELIGIDFGDRYGNHEEDNNSIFGGDD